MTPLQALTTEALFRLSNLTWLDVLDVALVSSVFYILLSIIRYSRAAFLLRGLLILSVFVLALTVIFPLPAFEWLIRILLIVILVSVPGIFQPELRRRLEKLGYQNDGPQNLLDTVGGKTAVQLIQTAQNLSAKQIGALIALEGKTSLQDIVETGIFCGGLVSNEFLEAIFFVGNPLHDGAVVISQDQIVAAGCLLPLTEKNLEPQGNGTQRRFGTRHRAAVGLSETSDALVIIISEETGELSIARNGRLYQNLNQDELRSTLLDFYGHLTLRPNLALLRGIMHHLGQTIRHPHLPGLHQFLSGLGLLLVAIILAVATWAFVTEQANPLREARVEGVTLRVENTPPNTTLVAPPRLWLKCKFKPPIISCQTCAPVLFRRRFRWQICRPACIICRCRQLPMLKGYGFWALIRPL